MKTVGAQEPSGKVTAGVVSVGGLILVWGIVWANLPSKEELFSAQHEDGEVAKVPAVQELDLTIPGVAAAPPNPALHKGTEAAAMIPSQETGETQRARQIAEVKCEAEVQQVCPDALVGDDRRQCVARRMKQFSPACQHIVRQRMVRWKEEENYRFACAEDVKRVCRGVEPGEGRVLQCLHEHAQDVSEPCYQSLPKGTLLLRN